jgi:hypothetical protein
VCVCVCVFVRVYTRLNDNVVIRKKEVVKDEVEGAVCVCLCVHVSAPLCMYVQT